MTTNTMMEQYGNFTTSKIMFANIRSARISAPPMSCEKAFNIYARFKFSTTLISKEYE